LCYDEIGPCAQNIDNIINQWLTKLIGPM
jgi:hypothetical protein